MKIKMISNTNLSYILTLSCQDARGIVAAVSGFIMNHQGNVIDSAQFRDESTNQFFLRMEFMDEGEASIEAFKQQFDERIASRFAMQWQLDEAQHKPRLLLMVSKFGHCLYDLLHRMHTGTLPVEVPAIISNHEDLREVAEWYKVPFYHLPVGEDKAAQEAQVLELIDEHQIDLVVLARYMQILSQNMCEQLEGRAINIHHSFLPSFKGARPYHQAFERGVKIIGATAHYVTSDLDEGPIIEQEVTRVDHSFKPKELTAAGRDIECLVLAKAIKYHIEHRVIRNGSKTVVFR
ncbi:MAG: formyltetrahydrofolate deformylase [Rickettsiales bacterium]|nr:formyltetrahydrofolate deformylase [Rickettsiales bacterium]